MDSFCNYLNAIFGNAPLMGQHEWDNAPHNRPDLKEIEVEGTVVITIEKKVKIKTTSYLEGELEHDDDGNAYREIELIGDEVSEQLREKALSNADLKKYKIVDSYTEDYETV